MEKKCRKPRPFFNDIFGEHWTTSLMVRQPHLLNVNHCTLSYLTKMSVGVW